MIRVVLRPAWRPGVGAAALLAAASLVQAQQAPERVRHADPLDAQAPVPAAHYRSALADYRPLGDDRRVGWKEANETVNRIGGWRAYAREVQQPAPAAGAVLSLPAASAPAAAPVVPAAGPSAGSPGHGHGHGRHGGRP